MTTNFKDNDGRIIDSQIAEEMAYIEKPYRENELGMMKSMFSCRANEILKWENRAEKYWKEVFKYWKIKDKKKVLSPYKKIKFWLKWINIDGILEIENLKNNSLVNKFIDDNVDEKLKKELSSLDKELIGKYLNNTWFWSNYILYRNNLLREIHLFNQKLSKIKEDWNIEWYIEVLHDLTKIKKILDIFKLKITRMERNEWASGRVSRDRERYFEIFDENVNYLWNLNIFSLQQDNELNETLKDLINNETLNKIEEEIRKYILQNHMIAWRGNDSLKWWEICFYAYSWENNVSSARDEICIIDMKKEDINQKIFEIMLANNFFVSNNWKWLWHWTYPSKYYRASENKQIFRYKKWEKLPIKAYYV